MMRMMVVSDDDDCGGGVVMMRWCARGEWIFIIFLWWRNINFFYCNIIDCIGMWLCVWGFCNFFRVKYKCIWRAVRTCTHAYEREINEKKNVLTKKEEEKHFLYLTNFFLFYLLHVSECMTESIRVWSGVSVDEWDRELSWCVHFYILLEMKII